jgi:hypothetical protein
MWILRSNLISALRVAISSQDQYERELLHYTSNSSAVIGWKWALKALENGEDLEIRGENES